MERMGRNSEVQDAKGMLTTAILGVVTAIILSDFIDQAGFASDSIAGTVLGFVVPIVAVAVLLKIMGYI